VAILTEISWDAMFERPPCSAHPGNTLRMGNHVMRIEPYGQTKYWALLDTEGTLICLCIYRKGAGEVVRRLQAQQK
jgi:hypothetical protein